jgi:hypothetical protein
MRKSDKAISILDEYSKDRKYWCSKCKYYENNKCLKKRIILECKKRRLRNV